MTRPPELLPLGPAYAQLYDRIEAVVAPRVRALRVGTGSLTRGSADAYSDLDLVAEVADPDSFDAVTALREATPTVLLRRMPFGAIAITPEWLRVDLAVVAPGQAGGPPDPPPTDIAALAEEFLRVLGLLPVVVGRGEWIVASDGAWLLRSFLVRLLLAENGEGAATGVKRLTEKLTAEQRLLVEALPPIAATRESAVACHIAIAAAFMTRARRLAPSWPEELESATRSYLQRELGLELPAA